MPAEQSSPVAFFDELLRDNPDKSTGLAAMETLFHVLQQSKASTIAGLMDELRCASKSLAHTDHSRTSLESASELFMRFISLVNAKDVKEKEDDFNWLMATFQRQGQIFIERVSKSRQLIAINSRPFLLSHKKILTHSYSKVVLESMKDAHSRGVPFEVFVTESQPDRSGEKMHAALRQLKIRSTLVLDSAVGYLMERVDMVVVGAEGVMETGGIINKIGTLTLAICARAFNKPVYVMAESIKFVKEFPLNQRDIPDAFKYRASVLESGKLDEEHPLVDYTPPHLIDLLFTDLGIFTPAAVGDELIKLYT